MSQHKTSLRILIGLAMVYSLVCLAYAMKTDEKQKAETNGKKNIIATIEGLPECSKFLECVKKTGVMKELEGKGPFTVLVPVNTAYDAVPEKMREKIKENSRTEEKLARFHIIKGDKSVAELKTIRESETFNENGEHIDFTRIITEKVNDIIQREIPCSNGRIYLIKEVLIPERLEKKLMKDADHGTKSEYGNTKVINGESSKKSSDTVKPSTATTPESAPIMPQNSKSVKPESNSSSSQPTMNKTITVPTVPTPATQPLK